MFNEDLRKPIKLPDEKYKNRNVNRNIKIPKEIKSKKCEYVYIGKDYWKKKIIKKCKKSASGIIHYKRKVMFVCKEHFGIIKEKNKK